MSASNAGSSSASLPYRDLFGYLNFSDGAPNPRFRACWNEIFQQLPEPRTVETLRQHLDQQLAGLQATADGAFAQMDQAQTALNLAFDRVVPEYLDFHKDLLFHVETQALCQPFFIALLLESTLAALSDRELSNDDQRAASAIRRVSTYVGYRPVAVLENERQAEVYEHERYCPLPLYLSGSGVAEGRYHTLITAMLGFLKTLPEDLKDPAHFDLDRLDELSLDIRSHDHLHPVNKRTNYMFGEWDPEVIDLNGFYRRFVIRNIILDSLQVWLETENGIPLEERIFDASAVLAGTILMASAISGAGPGTFDSSVSLTSLLPVVARQRDNFYQALINTADGPRRKRLVESAELTRQPFGHVRLQLNMHLSQYGARQVQHRHLSTLYASLGFPEPAREEALVIPCVSARFEAEIQSRTILVQHSVSGQDLSAAQNLVFECIDLLRRGIRCGAIVDPWNVLGFQAMFPLFLAREDAIPDNRVELLIDLVESIFDAAAATMAEAGASKDSKTMLAVESEFRDLAEEWDQYATIAVAELPRVSGAESLTAARDVARALLEWRNAGEAAGDISFWKGHVDNFQSPRSFARVVSALLDREDTVAAMGLLMQWLSEAESMGLESGAHSMNSLLHRLLKAIADDKDQDRRWLLMRRLFAFLEANAGDFWTVPSLSEFASQLTPSEDKKTEDLDHLFDDEDEDPNDDNLYGAAYDNVVFQDSADDGVDSDTADDGYGVGTTEFEQLYRSVEPRLKFLHTLGSLYSGAAVSVVELVSQVADDEAAAKARLEKLEQIQGWLSSIQLFRRELGRLISEVRAYEIKTLSADLDANIEYDIQAQSRYLMMQNVISTTVEYLMAERLLLSALLNHDPATDDPDKFDQDVVAVLRAVLENNVEEVRTSFPAFCESLRKRPLLYVPFESGGQPARILKARTLQSLIRLLLSQLPRLGLIEETYRLLQTAYAMERHSRPLGQAVTEFDRLFRMGLSCSVEAILHASKRWKTDTPRQKKNVFRRIERLLDAYGDLWTKHSSSMRLSIVEELHDDERAETIENFIESYGDDLFHTRMLTLGNARAIVHHGADSLLEELEQTQGLTQTVQIIDDINESRFDREEATAIMEFVYEAVVDNFDRFLEYNTTTTHSDYGHRLYCLLDFLRLESLYDRFSWNHIPHQVAHEAATRIDNVEIAEEIEADLASMTRGVAQSLVEELQELEAEYGVQLPSLHDRIHERIVGALKVNSMTARVRRCSLRTTQKSEQEAKKQFEILRQEIADFMDSRLGSGIEPPDWMQRLGREFERVHELHAGATPESLSQIGFAKITQRNIDQQLSRLMEVE